MSEIPSAKSKDPFPRSKDTFAKSKDPFPKSKDTFAMSEISSQGQRYLCNDRDIFPSSEIPLQGQKILCRGQRYLSNFMHASLWSYMLLKLRHVFAMSEMPSAKSKDPFRKVKRFPCQSERLTQGWKTSCCMVMRLLGSVCSIWFNSSSEPCT